MTIEWNERWDTVDTQINHQHQQLFVLINQVIHSADAAQTSACVQHLLHYFDAHFAYEELQMRQSRYPLIDDHVADHAQFRSKMHHLQQNQSNLSPVLYKFQLVAVFKEWMQQHILQHDAKLAEFLSYGETRQASL